MSSSLEFITHSGGSDTSWLSVPSSYQRSVHSGIHGKFWFTWDRQNTPWHQSFSERCILSYTLNGSWCLTDIPLESRTLRLGSIGISVGENYHVQKVTVTSSPVREKIDESLEALTDSELVSLGGVSQQTIWLENHIWECLLGDEELLAKLEEHNRRVTRDLVVGIFDEVGDYELVQRSGWLVDLFATHPVRRSENSHLEISERLPEPTPNPLNG